MAEETQLSEARRAEYLGELRRLEDFRSRYHGRYPATPLEPEEPGVQRILEAIAFFATRTRQAAESEMNAATHRLFETYFDSLLVPLPAKAMVQAVVGDRLADARTLSKGTEVRLTTTNGVGATFHTTRDVHVLPIWLERTRVLLRPEGGYRLVLRFVARFQRQESLGVLPLLVRYLDDYRASLQILHQLRCHLERTSIVYDGAVNEATRGEPCRTSFGPVPLPENGARDLPTLEDLRGFYQFPQSELFFHVHVPDRRQGGGWSAFSLVFDLKSGWQEANRSSAEVFSLFSAPLTNQHREQAQPISSDGTRTSYPILHSDPKAYFKLQSVSAVQEVSQLGRTPLRRAAVPGTGEAEYDLQPPDDAQPQDAPTMLLVHQPAAYLAPRTLTVEASWHQPWFEAHAIGLLDASLPGQHVEGLKLKLLGPVERWAASPLANAPGVLTELLTLKMRSALSLDEVRMLQRILCASKDSPYARLPDRIVGFSSRSIPAGGRDDAGVRRRYSLTLDRFEPEEEGLMWSFLTHMRDLLDIWSGEGPVELEVAAPGSTPSKAFLEEFSP